MQSRVPKLVYKVKVLNPIRRKKAITRQLHDFTGRFSTVLQVKQQIIKELGDILPTSPSPDLIEVGYFEGRQSTKLVIASSKDLDAMYEKLTVKKEFFCGLKIYQKTIGMNVMERVKVLRRRRRKGRLMN